MPVAGMQPRHPEDTMPFSWPHIHLMLNHIPVLATLFGLVLLAVSIWQESEELKKTALYTFFVTAIFSVTTYLTGDPTADAVKGIACVADDAIKRHDNFASYAMSGSVALGILSAAVILRNVGRKVGRGETALVLVAALAVTGALAWTAELGGRIHHEELRPGYTAPVQHEKDKE